MATESRKECRCNDSVGGYGSLVVRNHLHKFYEPEVCSSCTKDEQPMLSHASELGGVGVGVGVGRSRLCWKLGAWLGLVLLLSGLLLLLVGFGFPRRHVLVTNVHELQQMQQAEQFNRRLELCKLTGLGLACLGGSAAIVCLLVPTLLRSLVGLSESCSFPSESHWQASSSQTELFNNRASRSDSVSCPHASLVPCSLSTANLP